MSTPKRRKILSGVLAGFAAAWILASMGCGMDTSKPRLWGVEDPKFLPGTHRQVWAVAPVINLSGMNDADPILQADLVYAQLQQIQGLTVIPVDRVVAVYQALHIVRVQSEKQAGIVCNLLGCDALVVPTITQYDPYNPPKLGASLQLFLRPLQAAGSDQVDPRELARQGAAETQALPQTGNFVQVVGFYDAENGSVRQALTRYAKGRDDPTGPYLSHEYLVNMERYCGFVYSELIDQLMQSPRLHSTL